jgi:hypothetical protein
MCHPYSCAGFDQRLQRRDKAAGRTLRDNAAVRHAIVSDGLPVGEHHDRPGSIERVETGLDVFDRARVNIRGAALEPVASASVPLHEASKQPACMESYPLKRGLLNVLRGTGIHNYCPGDLPCLPDASSVAARVNLADRLVEAIGGS